ncbi:retrovirus-related pol polyprotein from transposon TNT 1-94 [Tanacetum coccineum]
MRGFRIKKYAELSAAEKIQADCDMKATNIILQGLPADIYSLVNHHRVAKDLWERVQLLMQGGNTSQIHAYLEQHKLHANEVRLLCERNQDPLAFVANQQMTLPHFNTYQSLFNNPQLQQQFSPSQYGSIHPNQLYSSSYQSQPHFNHSSVPPSYPYQSQMNHQTSSVPQIAYQSPQVTTQPMTESPLMDSSFVVPIFSLGDDPIACLNKAMAFLTAVASSRFPSTNNQLRTSSNPRNQATIQDGRVTVQQVHGRQGQSYSDVGFKSNATSSGGNNASGQARVVKCYNCQGEGHMARQCTQPKRPRNATWYKGKSNTEDLDTYDSDCDDISNAQAVLMANISNYGSDVISEVPYSETYLNDMENQGVHAMQDFEQPPGVDFTYNEIHSDSNIIPYSQYLQETQHINVQDTYLQAQQDSMISYVIEQMKAQWIKPTLYDGIVISDKHVAMPVIDDEETLILEEKSRSKILSEDFGKRFTPQQEMDAEQAFWFRISNPTIESSNPPPVKVEVPSELPKVSLVNESLKKLKFHLA